MGFLVKEKAVFRQAPLRHALRFFKKISIFVVCSANMRHPTSALSAELLGYRAWGSGTAGTRAFSLGLIFTCITSDFSNAT